MREKKKNDQRKWAKTAETAPCRAGGLRRDSYLRRCGERSQGEKGGKKGKSTADPDVVKGEICCPILQVY